MTGDRILLAHGSGGKLSHELVAGVFAPAFANSSAVARPIPREAPVTSAVFSANSILTDLLEIIKRFLQGLHIFYVECGNFRCNLFGKAG